MHVGCKVCKGVLPSGLCGEVTVEAFNVHTLSEIFDLLHTRTAMQRTHVMDF